MVKPKSYTESEQIAILHAVLLNKDILEAPRTKSKSHNDAWRIKWEEIAASIDAYFGTKRGPTSVRSLYTHWKTAAKRKHSSIQLTALNENDYENTLTMAERILRQICPDIFPKVGDGPSTSTNSGNATDKVTSGNANKVVDEASNKVGDKTTDEVSDKVADEVSGKVADEVSDKVSDETTDKVGAEEEQNKAKPPENSKNGHEENPSLPENEAIGALEPASNAAKDCDDLEELIERAEPSVEVKNHLNSELPILGNSDLDGLVLSLQSMIDIPSEIESAVANDPTIFESGQKMEDDIGEIVEAIQEYVDEKSQSNNTGSEMKNEDAGPSLDENEKMNVEEPLDLTRDDKLPENIVVASNEESKLCEGSEKIEELVSAVDEDDRSDEKEIEKTEMDTETNAEVSEEKSNEENPEKPLEPTAPESIVETNEILAGNSEDPRVSRKRGRLAERCGTTTGWNGKAALASRVSKRRKLTKDN